MDETLRETTWETTWKTAHRLLHTVRGGVGFETWEKFDEALARERMASGSDTAHGSTMQAPLTSGP